jgi:hypothetical protein
MGHVMATPSVMLRFRDVDVPSIDAHNDIFKEKGRVLWGLWLKAFEDKDEVIAKLGAAVTDRIYLANTTNKSKPEISICDVRSIIFNRAQVDEALVPEYYRSRKDEVPVWFEVVSRIGAIDADQRLKSLLGVPTIYFLDYDKDNNIINTAIPRRYPLNAKEGARWALLLSDIHLGEDHAFRYPIEKSKGDVNPKRTFSEVLKEDLAALKVLDQIGCVIISGDILTKGAWSVAPGRMTGLELAKEVLYDLAKEIGVDPSLFCMVPGNHDIVRKPAGSAQDVQEALLHYSHESGFRALREEFCNVYKLSPLNYVAQIEYGKKTLLLGLLNSAYLNETTEFAEYGYVGDDADVVFDLLKRETSDAVTKIVVLHHHVLPVYEREVVAANGKISMTLDSAGLLRQAQEANVAIVLHGHQHSTKRMTYSSASAEMTKECRIANRSVTIVAAGSSGAKRERLPPDETNAYALIDLADKSPAVTMRRIFSEGRRGEEW